MLLFFKCQLSKQWFVIEFHQEDLAKNKRAVGSYTDKTVENVKDGAASKAMAKMDKKERREITDHSWLKQEAVRYKQEVILLKLHCYNANVRAYSSVFSMFLKTMILELFYGFYKGA